jgi:hypothetical protein
MNMAAKHGHDVLIGNGREESVIGQGGVAIVEINDDPLAGCGSGGEVLR